MKHNLTIVSAFITGINQSPDKTIDKYLEYGSQLMRVRIPKIIFIDETLYEKVSQFMDEYTMIIPYKLTDIYMYQYRDKLKNVKVATTNAKKDTIEYFMVQCHKTEWIRKAIQINKYDSEQYMWIDFGIYQFIDKLNLAYEEKFNKFTESLYQIEYQKTDKVKMPGMWNMNACCTDMYNYLKLHVCWYFAGSLFGGHKDTLIKFADYTRDRCLKMITEDSWLVWEVNVWYLVYCEHPELFIQYKAQHDLTIFENYKDNLTFVIPMRACDGLGNKLKAFIDFLSINKNTKIENADAIPYNNFGSILSDKYIYNEKTDTNCMSFYTNRLLVLKREEKEQDNLINEFSQHSFDVGELKYLYSDKHIDTYYERDRLSSALKSRILNTIHSIQFKPHIYEKVNQMTIFKGITLIVSIRTWNAPTEKNVQRPYDSNIYKNKIREVLDKHKNIENIYVTIDNESYLKEYMGYFMGLHKTVYFYHRPSDLSELENAMIQVLIASKCQYMIGNRISSFTELIWWFSDLKTETYTVY